MINLLYYEHFAKRHAIRTDIQKDLHIYVFTFLKERQGHICKSGVNFIRIFFQKKLNMSIKQKFIKLNNS